MNEAPDTGHPTDTESQTMFQIRLPGIVHSIHAIHLRLCGIVHRTRQMPGVEREDDRLVSYVSDLDAADKELQRCSATLDAIEKYV